MYSEVWMIAFWSAMILFQIVAIPALIFRKNDLADVIWGPAFTLTAMVALIMGREHALGGADLRISLVLIALGVWSIRLFIHIGRRNLGQKTEDPRYESWRKQWGTNWLWRSYLQIFVLQGLILFVILTPALLAVASASEPLSIIAWFGIVVWVAGFCFEAIADEQLRRFKTIPENTGKILTTGLWSWSRHPNYFGETVQWWGLWLLVFDLPFSWLTLISPIGMTFLILRVSGVSLLEEMMKKRPGYLEYEKKTSIFIPRPPRKERLSDSENS